MELHDRRLRMIRATPQAFEALLNGIHRDGAYMPTSVSLPPDIKIVDMQFVDETLWVKVFHPSFESVPVNATIPELDMKLETRRRGVSAFQMAELLNEVRLLDPAVIETLFTIRRQCNKQLADHPTVICSTVEGESTYWIGFLGLLNGMLARIGADPLLLVRIVDDQTNAILGFDVRPQSDFRPEPLPQVATTAQVV